MQSIAATARRQRLLLLFLPLLALLPLAAAPPAAAQQPRPEGALRLEGRVLRAGSGQPGVEVTLHRVTREEAGVVGAARSGARGEFSFPLSPPDTVGFTVHFTTVDFLGVRYFGPALHPGEAPVEYTIEVFDTAAAATLRDSVRIARREVMLHPDAGRGWEVNEVLLLRNEARRTLVSADGLPTWEFGIPEGVTGFEMGEGEIAPDDLRRMEERVFVLAPLPPGTREIFLRYRLPAGLASLRLPTAQPTELLHLYVQQPAPALEAAGFEALGPMEAEGVSFLRYRAAGIAPGAELRLSWRAAPASSLDPTVAAIALAVLVLALGAVAAVYRRERSALRPAAPGSGEGAPEERERSEAAVASADDPPP